MRHVLRFEGGFERNFPTLRPGTKQGKRFVAVRVGNGEQEVVLEHPVRLDPARHLGGRRFSATPIPLGDEPAGALLGDMLDATVDQRAELVALRDWVRRAISPPATP